MISVIIPTFKEVENIPHITAAVCEVLSAANMHFEIVFVDDNSEDGSEEAVASLGHKYPVRILVRKGVRGLSSAVLHGIDHSEGDYIVVMDADLSHPATAIPEMINMLDRGDADFVLGSRYVEGGTIHEDWGLFRKINSRLPSLMVFPLTSVKDPMSGFFALKRKDMPPEDRLSPIGYKIGLEILVKGNFENPGEVPIHFSERKYGESKLSVKEQVYFLRHLRRLFQYRYPAWTEFVQFGMVGSTGVVIDLTIYLSVQAIFLIDHKIARAISFVGAASWNWALNRLITFTHREKMSKIIQWPAFIMTSSLGFAINWGTYVIFTSYVPFFSVHKILALLIGVLLGMGLNFMMARLFVFRPYEKEIASEDETARIAQNEES
jgi:dolichol-phosphate mannosyltransferase